MQRYVIDANCADSPAFDRWISKSQTNIALITTTFAIETYRRKLPNGIRKSYEILARYPTQLRVVKSPEKLSCLHIKPKGQTARMFDDEGTRDLQKLCSQTVRRSDIEIERAFSHLVQQADGELAKLSNDMQGIGQELANDLDELDAKSLHAFRTGKPYNDALIRHLLSRVIGTTTEIYRTIPGCFIPERAEDLIYCFPCRLVLCGALALRARARHGNIASVKTERLRNDLLDAQYVATALYFDGLLTNDEGMRGVYQEAKVIVNLLSNQSN